MEKFVEIDIDTICNHFYSRQKGSEFYQPSEDEEILKANIIVTTERKNFIFLIIEQLFLFLENKYYLKDHLLTGIQGIGKSYSLLLLAHCLKIKEIPQIFHVVMINECRTLSYDRWEYIFSEFKKSFPDEIEYFEENLQEKDKLIRSFIRSFLAKAQQEKIIVILIVDQINWAFGIGDKILEELLSFKWTMIILSESANNNIVENKRYLVYQKHEFNKMLSESSVELIIRTEFNKMNFNSEEIAKIIKSSSFVVREAIRICLTEGHTIDDKILNYETTRIKDFQKIHTKFKNLLQPEHHESLLKSIFYMDTNCFIFSNYPPIIDKQLMTYEIKQKDSKLYKTFSILPIVHDFLKQDIYENNKINLLNMDFYNRRINEIKPIIRNSLTDSRVRGIYFEDLIILRLRQSHSKNEQICFMIQTSKYLNSLNIIDYKVNL